jgi:hypothetical protein
MLALTMLRDAACGGAAADGAAISDGASDFHHVTRSGSGGTW